MAKCPFTGLKVDCPETREGKRGCQLWEFYPAEETSEATGRKIIKEVGMCTLQWQTKIAYDAAGFNDYTGKAVDKLRSESQKRQNQLVSFVHTAANNRLLDAG